MFSARSNEEWEARFAPYDQATYQAALKHLHPEDVVLDIGAGDLRFARQAAAIALRVIAIERNFAILQSGMGSKPIPSNLQVVCADALTWRFPPGITTGVLLMRHCTHFRQYAEKLRQCGAQRLITNARWRLDVELIDLNTPPLPYAQYPIGAYACGCGATGFKIGPVELLTTLHTLDFPQEVELCPSCASPSS